MKCKWELDEICVNADCPMCCDYCPVVDYPDVCKWEERVDADEIQERLYFSFLLHTCAVYMRRKHYRTVLSRDNIQPLDSSEHTGDIAVRFGGDGGVA